MKQSAVVNPPSMKGLYDNFHFAAAARSSDLLLCSGQLGVGPDGRAIADPAAQFAAAFEGVRAVLKEAGLDFTDVIEITTFHVGLREHLGTFMKAKDAVMPAPHSAWTAIGVTELAFPGALVEVRATAQLRKPAARAKASQPRARAKAKPAAKRKAARKR
jgi:enamine deaminase RidA (YjgF/YER057c/UK114 family)